jgi:hypothetical protein
MSTTKTRKPVIANNSLLAVSAVSVVGLENAGGAQQFKIPLVFYSYLYL